MTVVTTFTVPEELAKNLTDLMAKQTINDRILAAVADQPEKYNSIMSEQIKIQRKIDEIKYNVTDRFVPTDYRSDRYTWNYNGFDVAGTEFEILIND